jgi:hypothetical protein
LQLFVGRLLSLDDRLQILARRREFLREAEEFVIADSRWTIDGCLRNGTLV